MIEFGANNVLSRRWKELSAFTDLQIPNISQYPWVPAHGVPALNVTSLPLKPVIDDVTVQTLFVIALIKLWFKRNSN